VSSLTTRIKSSRRASAITVALVIVLVAVAAWFGVISHVSQLKTDVAAAQSQLATATQAAAVANKAAAAASLRAMPGVSDQPGILDQLNALGKQSNVMIATVTPNLTNATTTAVPLSVTVDGTYFQIRTFLNKLRNQVRVGKGGRIVATGRLYDVQSVSIAPGNSTGQLAATIAVNAGIYSVPTPVAPASASTSATASAPAGSTN
jgi:Tfp pilus assembly protein PilO